MFNLASQYDNNEMYTEALNTYAVSEGKYSLLSFMAVFITLFSQVITKNRMFNNAGKLKVNMGNIHFKMGQYNKAIKYYRMALDQVLMSL